MKSVLKRIVMALYNRRLITGAAVFRAFKRFNLRSA